MAAYGIRGSADYGYAAAFQNAYMHRRQSLQEQGLRNGTSLSYCWGAWNIDRYMPADRDRRLKELGLDNIDMKSAFALLQQRRHAGVVGALAVADRALACRRLGIEAGTAVEQGGSDRTVAPDPIEHRAGDPAGAEEARRKLEVHLAEWERRRRDGATIDADLWSKVLSQYDIDALDETLIERLEHVLFATEDDRASAAASPEPEADPPENRANGSNATMHQIRDIVSHVLMIDRPDVDEPLQRYGLDSVGAMQVASALSRKFGRIVEPKQLLQHRSVRLLADHLAVPVLEATG